MGEQDKPGFLGGGSGGSSGTKDASRGHDISSNPEAGEQAPAGETFGADNPVENTPFPGTMSRA